MGTADQAQKLRKLVHRDRARAPQPLAGAKVLAITSGKGGVGKTNVTVNLAIALSSLGRKVAILDADYALANIDILLGFSPKYTIEHVLSGEAKISDIMVEVPGGVQVVPAASGVQHLSSLSGREQNLLFNALHILEKHFDHLLIDTSAGISDNVIYLLRAAGEVVVVTNSEPPSFVDSYAIIKLLLTEQPDAQVKVIVNSSANEKEGEAVFKRISDTVSRFLQISIGYLGYVADDNNVKKAVKKQRPFILQYPNSPASRCISSIARKLVHDDNVEAPASFLEKLKTVMRGSAAGA